MKAKRQQVNIRTLKKRFPACGPHVELFELIQKTVYSVIFTAPAEIDRESLNKALRNGKTVLDACPAPLDIIAFNSALGKLFRILSTRNPGTFSKPAQAEIPAGLMDDYLCAREEPLASHAESLGVAPAELISCCQQAARPQLVSLREKNSSAVTGIWPYGYCPFCGALPAMAYIDKRGFRSLYCPNCLTAYRFKRHHCPCCAHAGLQVLQMDAWSGLLLEKCPECGKYLKTWNGKAGPPPCPFPYLDIVTRDVDEAAQAQEMNRMSLGVMGV